MRADRVEGRNAARQPGAPPLSGPGAEPVALARKLCQGEFPAAGGGSARRARAASPVRVQLPARGLLLGTVPVPGLCPWSASCSPRASYSHAATRGRCPLHGRPPGARPAAWWGPSPPQWAAVLPSAPRAPDPRALLSVPSKAGGPWHPAATGVGCSCPQSKGASRLPTRPPWCLGPGSVVRNPPEASRGRERCKWQSGDQKKQAPSKGVGQGVGPGARGSQARRGPMFPSPGGPRVPVCREKRGNLGFHRSCHSCEHANSLPAERGPRRLGFPGGEGSGGGVGLAPLAPASPPLPPSAPSPRPSSKQEAPLQPRLSPRWAAARSGPSTFTFISLKSHRVTGEPGGPGTKPATPAVRAGAGHSASFRDTPVRRWLRPSVSARPRRAAAGGRGAHLPLAPQVVNICLHDVVWSMHLSFMLEK